MKKNIFSKIVASLATVAMAVGMFASMPASDAKAAADVELYFKLPSGWTAETTGFNVWGENPEVTGSGNTVSKPASWGEGTLGQVTNSGDGWVSVVVKDTSKLAGLQFVSTENASYNKGDGDNLWNAEINKQNVVAAYFDTTTNAWYKEKACTNEIKPPVLDDIYYIAGSDKLVGVNWSTTAEEGKMVADGDNFTKTFKNVVAGKHEFKVLQDPADFGWDNAFVTEETSNGNAVVTVGTEEDTKTYDVTITINKITKAVTATVVEHKEEESSSKQEESSSKQEESSSKQEETSSKQEETSTKTEETTTKTEETKPNTGDSSSVVLMIAVAAVAAGAVVVSRRRTVSE